MSKYLDDIGVKYLWDKTIAKIESEVNAVKDEMGDLIEIPTITIEDIDKIISEEGSYAM